MVRQALQSAGGDALAQAATADPVRRAEIATVLGGLGTWELDPRSGPDELEAAAAACRGAGWWAAPYPIAERLSRPAGLSVDALVVVSETRPAAAAACLELRLGTEAASKIWLNGQLLFERHVYHALTQMDQYVVPLRLAAGRNDISDELQALCFLAGANSIFYGEKLLTTGNPDVESDRLLFKRLKIAAEPAPSSR